jgi:predicted RNase H-like nuclease (RuvC/YqgF family)
MIVRKRQGSAEMARRMQMLGFLGVVVCTLALGGCKNKEKERALVEAEEARTELNKVRGDLARTRREVADLRKELVAAKETRDELHLKVEQLLKERTGVAAAAEQTQETVRALTAQSTEQAQSVESLQKEIKQLRMLIETQQALITEQQATIAELQKTPGVPAGTTVGQEGPAGQQGGGEPNKVNEP